MNLTRGVRGQTLSYIYRGLIIVLIFFGLVFIGGTIYAVFFQSTPMENRRSDIPQISGTEQIFTGIGRIRVSTADPQPGMVIIFVLFEYNSGDRPFSEELALRVGEFRNIIREYVGSFSIIELQQLSEETIKAELLRRFNQILRLGRIETLYFNDFMILG